MTSEEPPADVSPEQLAEFMKNVRESDVMERAFEDAIEAGMLPKREDGIVLFNQLGLVWTYARAKAIRATRN